VPLQVTVRSRFGIFWDFSDSFVGVFSEVRQLLQP
jgi:hypothetical protein